MTDSRCGQLSRAAVQNTHRHAEKEKERERESKMHLVEQTNLSSETLVIGSANDFTHFDMLFIICVLLGASFVFDAQTDAYIHSI